MTRERNITPQLSLAISCAFTSFIQVIEKTGHVAERGGSEGWKRGVGKRGGSGGTFDLYEPETLNKTRPDYLELI